MRRHTGDRMIGERLRSAREAAGLSRQQLAWRIGYHVDTLRKWETGERGISLFARRCYLDGCARRGQVAA